MKFCAIVPPGCEHLLPQGQAVLCFANVALDNKKYRDFYAEWSHAGNYVVVDNEIYEKVEPLGNNDYADMVEYIAPDVAIIPDIRGDADGTMKSADYYLRYLRGTATDKAVGLYGVVQGTNHEDNTLCAEYWASKGVDGVAVPMRVDGREMSRLDLYREIVRPALPTTYKVHLLGVEAWPYTDEEILSRFPEIVSCDTAEPTSAAYRGVQLNHAEEFVSRPDGFMTSQAIKDQLELNKIILWTNFEILEGKFGGKQ